MELCTPETVISILEEKVGVPSTTPNIVGATWEELGVESLGLAEVLANLEHTLELEVTFDQALQTRNVTELVTLINTAR